MKLNLVTSLSAVAVVALLGTGPAGAQMRWDLPTEQRPTTLSGIGNIKFAELMKQKTSGQIDVTVHFGGSLGYKTKDQYDAVTDGAVPLADSYTGPFIGFDPIWQLSALPFLARTIDEAFKLYGSSRPAYEEILGKSNQILLYATPWPASGIWAKDTITTVDKLKNLKIRTYDPLGLMTFKAAGAAPITLTFADVVPQISTGGISAVLTSADGGIGSKFHEMLSHFIEINYAAPLSVVHMNKDVWGKLAANHQKATREASEESAALVWEAAKTRVQENYAVMRKANMTVIENPPAELLTFLEKSAQGAIDEWRGKVGTRGDKVLVDYRKRIGR
ncbi:MAG: C4-dicarboxylate ABC transporter substrate-binding protein [Alphaproteobacteria bacterium]|nr:C4-dicarboxylate ABC transporter substrate-binding protein [Alphaproteobacteria bacterium]